MIQQQAYFSGIESLVNSAFTESESTQTIETDSASSREQMELNDPKTEEVASFLLSLKHRSVSPEPHESSAETTSYEDLFEYSSPNPYLAQPSNEPSPVSPEILPVKSLLQESTPLFPEASTSSSEYDLVSLLDGSSLVKLDDRDLVPDALFVAMAQMKLCHLTQADRVGCYKAREIGFVGMCCKHCGGQPGFGRYFPNSVRSLAQTTTSQTILKHIGGKCRYTPASIRTAVLDMQKEQAEQEGLVSGRPRYGSRKVFFQRVWIRLHGMNVGKGDMMAMEDDTVSKVSSSSNSFVGQIDNDDRSMMSGHSGDFEQTQHHSYGENEPKRKDQFGNLPFQKNKRIKVVGPTYDV